MRGCLRTVRLSALAVALLVASAAAQDRAARTLDVYVIDRIMAAVKDAGLTQIDHLITTHYHGDHFGAMAELTGRIPVREFIDHGPSVEKNAGTDAFLQNVYPGLYAKGRHTVVQPGHRFSMGDVDVRIVEAAGKPVSGFSKTYNPK
jgi:glyoxylase-like metal-dependent hydrolase (beta-lactamase superfamily II)